MFSLLSIAPLARIVRAQTLSLREREFVLAAAQPRRPHATHPVPRDPAQPGAGDGDGAFTGLGILLAAEGALAFLGFSVEAPDATWGLMINETRDDIDEAWWATIFPA